MNEMPPTPDLPRWLHNHLAEQSFEIDLFQFLDAVGYPRRRDAVGTKIALSHLADRLAQIGAGIEPDLRYTYPVSFSNNGVVVFKTSPHSYSPPDPIFIRFLAVLDIAIAEGCCRNFDFASAISNLAQLMNGAELNNLDRTRLTVRLGLIFRDASIQRLRPELRRLPANSARVALSAAAANGLFSIGKLRFLERACALMALPISATTAALRPGRGG